MPINTEMLHAQSPDDVAALKARIAELEKENAELKEQYKDMDVTHTVHIAKMNAKIEELESNERRLKRALWLARALRARDKAFEYHFKNNVEMCAKWDNVYLMLMAKAEEYK